MPASHTLQTLQKNFTEEFDIQRTVHRDIFL